MTDLPFIQWHPEARLFDATAEVARGRRGGTGLMWGSSTALDMLGAAVLDRRPFCLSDAASPPDIPLADGLFLTQSGGSSGTPKLIRRTQLSWIKSFEVNAVQFDMTPRDRVAVLGTPAHSLALYGVLEAMHLGVDAHVLARLSPSRQMQVMAEREITVLYATPTQIRMLMAFDAPLSHLRLILCGGGLLDTDTRDAAQAHFPNAAFHGFYGAAETSFITLAGPDTPQGSVGRAYPGVSIRILDQSGQPAKDVGTVWARSPYLCDGYADGRPLRLEDGYISAGEIGQLDGDGFLWLKGRQDRMVTIGDVNVFPETVEATIAAIPEVHNCAVLPQPDPHRGHHLVAVIRADVHSDALQIRDICRHKLGPAMTPKRVLTHPDFPLLPSGKPDLVALMHWLEDQP